jgi:hypothetical protein
VTQDEARKMVEEALDQRRKFGKHFTVTDMPPEFLDALVIEFGRLQQEAVQAERLAALETDNKALREQLTLANRQLGAAKARAKKEEAK